MYVFLCSQSGDASHHWEDSCWKKVWWHSTRNLCHSWGECCASGWNCEDPLILLYCLLISVLWWLMFVWLQDVENEDKTPLEEVPIEEILELQRNEQAQKQQEEELKKKALKERGLVPQSDPIQEDFFWFPLMAIHWTSRAVGIWTVMWCLTSGSEEEGSRLQMATPAMSELLTALHHSIFFVIYFLCLILIYMDASRFFGCVRESEVHFCSS